MGNVEHLSGTGIRFVDKKREPDINEIKEQYGRIMAGFSDKNRPGKASKISNVFQIVGERLKKQESFVFEERQEDIFKLKLARHLLRIPKDKTIDPNTLSDAIIESPRFLDEESGSLHHLLEVHEQKTLLKIAEMRKKRAEMTGNEEINLHEALFTTKSGNYYLARLLNMPHLEKESAHMEHSIGKSDSYINCMKKGDTEIFSLRKIEEDTPVITIKYDVKKYTIEQIRKKKDQILASTDPFFEDAIDALNQLRVSKNDKGKFREIHKINPKELRNFEIKPYHLLTNHGEIYFKDLKPENNPLLLKSGEIQLTPDITGKDASQLLSIIEHLELNPDKIARQPEEINKNTKAYVGKLETDIFDKIKQYNIENIYTSFPDGKVRIEKDFEVGPITLEEVERKKAQRNKNVMHGSHKIRISKVVKDMMQREDFPTLKSPEQISLVHLKVSDLGFKESMSILEIYHRAQKLGLELCPPEAGVYKCLQETNQQLVESYHIAMKQIDNRQGIPKVFSMVRSEDSSYLLDQTAYPSWSWSPDTELVFYLR